MNENVRAVTVAIFIGGTIWGRHFDHGAKPQLVLLRFYTIQLDFV